MGYRDDREALRERADELERELVTARAKAERMADLEHDVGAMQERLNAMRAELAGLQPPPPPPAPRKPIPTKSWLIGGLIGTLVVSALAISAVTARSGSGVVAPVMALSSPPAIVTPPPAPPIPTEEPFVNDSVPVPEPRLFEATFKGAVTQADVPGLPRGTPCAILARIRANKASDADVTGLEVACGGRSLYRSTDEFNGMSSLDNGAIEVPGQGRGESIFYFYYTDRGPRSGARGQASLSSRQRSGAVWRDSVPIWRVEFSMESTSAPVAPTNAADTEPLAVGVAEPLIRTGTVTKTTGAAPIGKGAACTLRVEPSFEAARCIATATCGKIKLYDFGWLACVTEGGELRSLADANYSANGGDPKLTYDETTRRLVIEDEIAGATWSVTAPLR